MMPEQAKLLLDAHDNVRVARLLTDKGFRWHAPITRCSTLHKHS